MKLKYELSFVEIDGDITAVPLDADEASRCVLQMNGVTADILHILKNDVSQTEIVSELAKEYDATEEQITRSVENVLAILRENKLLEENPAIPKVLRASKDFKRA